MFGYVRPYAPELRVRELEVFRALYCGICHALGRLGGITARCVLSYDFVFLAALLWQPGEAVRVEKRRCPVSLKKKRCCVNVNAATETAAGYGLILAYHKLRDDVADEGALRATAARVAMLALTPAYNRAARRFPMFDAEAREKLSRLSQAEADQASQSASLDAVADKFALLLAAAGGQGETETAPERESAAGHDAGVLRARGNLLYHIGRWLYLIDARDDLPEDFKKHRPNILNGRETYDDARLQLTATHSNNLAISAFELLPENEWSDILRNILCLGLPAVQERVFAGEWKRRRGYYGI
ncbi:MAG: DUF5685 family protein [Oscillospiraceae bacterium]|jgi:hypothetical protein|nr:DUF5685 family protein [Oscillospiraceae bacterium]